ncbi:MAG TPA: hypothetical protein VL049_19995 [Candidatus Dormibacteraeota bacterium]|nr:hypothetical protein [Candidatus Dormibacteraeota bacterium]
MWRTALLLLAAAALAAPPARADTTEPIKLTYLEGDYAGTTTVWSEDGKRILGYIAYRQYRQGDRLRIERTAYFRDGSSDEDTAEAQVGDRLRAIGGRSVIRDTRGKAVVDLRIDVAARRVSGFYVDAGKRETVDEEVDIGPGTYWGPLYQLVVKNFAANAADGKVVVQSVVPTPKPRVIDMQFARDGGGTVKRPGGSTRADRITLLPTVNFLIDPILQRLVPKTEFLIVPGEPPLLARFTGPRNYAGQMMRLE